MQSVMDDLRVQCNTLRECFDRLKVEYWENVEMQARLRAWLDTRDEAGVIRMDGDAQRFLANESLIHLQWRAEFLLKRGWQVVAQAEGLVSQMTALVTEGQGQWIA